MHYSIFSPTNLIVENPLEISFPIQLNPEGMHSVDAPPEIICPAPPRTATTPAPPPAHARVELCSVRGETGFGHARFWPSPVLENKFLLSRLIEFENTIVMADLS